MDNSNQFTDGKEFGVTAIVAALGDFGAPVSLEDIVGYFACKSGKACPMVQGLVVAALKEGLFQGQIGKGNDKFYRMMSISQSCEVLFVPKKEHQSVIEIKEEKECAAVGHPNKEPELDVDVNINEEEKCTAVKHPNEESEPVLHSVLESDVTAGISVTAIASAEQHLWAAAKSEGWFSDVNELMNQEEPLSEANGCCAMCLKREYEERQAARMAPRGKSKTKNERSSSSAKKRQPRSRTRSASRNRRRRC